MLHWKDIAIANLLNHKYHHFLDWKPTTFVMQQEISRMMNSGSLGCSAGSVRVVSGSGFRYVVPFPYRLHKMLSDVDSRGDASIVSWQPDGRHFKVHDPQRFVQTIIPNEFKQKSLKSFQRQLHLYGFQRTQDGPNKGAYFHESFVRDNRDLCLSIARIKAPKKSQMMIFKGVKNNGNDGEKIATSSSSTTTTRNSAMKAAKPNPKPILSFQKGVTISDPSLLLSKRRWFPAACTHGPKHQHSTKPKVAEAITPDLLSSLSTPATTTSSYTLNSSNTNQGAGQQQELQHPVEGQHHSLDISDDYVSREFEWFINAGIPMSAFDPVAIAEIPSCTPTSATTITGSVSSSSSSSSSTTINVSTPSPTSFEAAPAVGSDLFPCADEITSLFAMNHPTHQQQQEQLSLNVGVNLGGDLLFGENLPAIDDSLWAL